MACKFTMSIVQMEKTTNGDPEQVVQKIFWRMACKDGNHAVEEFGDVALQPPAPDGDFTPFDDLTETQVRKWVQDAMGTTRFTAMKNRLKARIDQIKAPAVVSVAPPWIKPATPEGAAE